MHQVHEATDAFRKIPHKDGEHISAFAVPQPLLSIGTLCPIKHPIPTYMDGGSINKLDYQTPLPESFLDGKLRHVLSRPFCKASYG